MKKIFLILLNIVLVITPFDFLLAKDSVILSDVSEGSLVDSKPIKINPHSELTDRELDNKYGKIYNIYYHYCVGIDFIIEKRPGLIIFYTNKYSEIPSQVSVSFWGTSMKVVEGYNVLKGGENRSLVTYNLTGVSERNLISIEIPVGLSPEYQFEWGCHIGPNVKNYSIGHIYKLPFKPSLNIKLSQGNGGWSHKEGSYYAIDWAMPIGTPILAARSGVILAKQDEITLAGNDQKAWGKESNLVYILHDDGSVARYLHLNVNSVVVNIEMKLR